MYLLAVTLGNIPANTSLINEASTRVCMEGKFKNRRRPNVMDGQVWRAALQTEP
jgi:hypothetical protein